MGKVWRVLLHPLTCGIYLGVLLVVLWRSCQ